MLVGSNTELPLLRGRDTRHFRLFSGKRVAGRAGYSLIELLISVVILGLLAALAVPRLALMRDNAFVATMRSDLRNFSQSEESYFYDNAMYTSSFSDLVLSGFQPSDQVTLTISEATATGWAVLADHTFSPVQCALFIGTAAPIGPATVQGRIDCN